MRPDDEELPFNRQRLREVRLWKHMPQAVLGKAIGRKQNDISNIENGIEARPLTFDDVRRLEAWMMVVDGTLGQKPRTPIESLPDPVDLREVIPDYQRLSKDQRAARLFALHVQAETLFAELDEGDDPPLPRRRQTR